MLSGQNPNYKDEVPIISRFGYRLIGTQNEPSLSINTNFAIV